MNAKYFIVIALFGLLLLSLTSVTAASCTTFNITGGDTNNLTVTCGNKTVRGDQNAFQTIPASSQCYSDLAGYETLWCEIRADGVAYDCNASGTGSEYEVMQVNLTLKGVSSSQIEWVYTRLIHSGAWISYGQAYSIAVRNFSENAWGNWMRIATNNDNDKTVTLNVSSNAGDLFLDSGFNSIYTLTMNGSFPAGGMRFDLVEIMLCYDEPAVAAYSVKVLPENATAGNDLYCNYTYFSSSKNNYSEQSSSYEWWKGGINQNIDSQMLAKGNLSPGDSWYCKVRPGDGLNVGNLYVSNNTVAILGTVRNPVFYVGINETWNSGGYFAGPERVVDFNEELLSALANCTADAEGYCNISLTFSSDSVGLLNVTDFEVFYTLPNPSLSIRNLSVVHSSGTSYIYEFVVMNDGDVVLSNVSWSLDTGDGVVNSSTNSSLNVGEELFVYVRHDYASQGAYTVVATALAGNVSASATINNAYLIVENLSVLNASGTNRIFEFYITNNLASVSLSNVSWSFNTANGVIINSTQNLSLEPRESAFVYLGYNFSTIGTFNVNTSAANNSFVNWQNLTITVT